MNNECVDTSIYDKQIDVLQFHWHEEWPWWTQFNPCRIHGFSQTCPRSMGQKSAWNMVTHIHRYVHLPIHENNHWISANFLDEMQQLTVRGRRFQFPILCETILVWIWYHSGNLIAFYWTWPFSSLISIMKNMVAFQFATFKNQRV